MTNRTENRKRNGIAAALRFFIPKIIKNKKRHNRKIKHKGKQYENNPAD